MKPPTAAEPSDTTVARDAPASVGQRLLWFLDHYRAGGAALNCPVVCRLEGPLELERLQAAVQGLVTRHEALRTTMERRGRHLWQVVHRASFPSIELVDLTGEADPERAMLRALEEELTRRIDPQGFPLRATLWKVTEHHHAFCLNVHHMASDAWSGAVQMRELAALYQGPEGAGSLPPIKVQYADFSALQASYLESDSFERDVAYWSRRLTGARFDAVPLASTSEERETARAQLTIGRNELQRLQALARQSKTTLFGLLLTLYFTGLHRLTGKTDVSVASLFANRMRPNLQNTVGFIANLVALRTTIAPDKSYREVLGSVQNELREAFLHQGCPLHLLPTEVTVQNGRRADETVFQMLPHALGHSRMAGLEVTMVTPEAIESRFELESTVVTDSAGLAVIVFWNRNRLEAEWVSELLQEYRAGVETILRDPDGIVATR